MTISLVSFEGLTAHPRILGLLDSMKKEKNDAGL